MNVELLHATFRGEVVLEDVMELCNSPVLELITALLHNTSISEKIVFVDEDDLLFVCCTSIL